MNQPTDLFIQASASEKDRRDRRAGALLSEFLDSECLVGDVIETGPETFKVLVHDRYRKEVGGLPLRCFLVATRLTPNGEPHPTDEDARLVLLRVVGADKASSKDVEYAKVEAARRASGEATTWDDKTHLDDFTLNELRFDVLICAVVGSIELRKDGGAEGSNYGLHYAYDIRDTYRGLGYKAYKPVGECLERIVNFTKPPTDEDHPLKGVALELGTLRYTSAGFDPFQLGKENVRVNIDPTDLIARKTALFGMSRTGKSNTAKVILESVYRLRASTALQGKARNGRIGMLVFDPNGEYANPNMQDGTRVPTAIRDVWRTVENAVEGDVLVYGWTKPQHDPDRRLIKINFYGSDPSDWNNPDEVERLLNPLVIGKEVIDGVLREETAKYIRAFRDTRLNPTGNYKDIGEYVRYRRSLLAYRAILSGAGFQPPGHLANANLKAYSRTPLFSQKVRDALESVDASAADILGRDTASWSDVRSALTVLAEWVHDPKSSYKDFNKQYREDKAKKGEDADDWADATLQGILSLLTYPGGLKVIRGPAQQHAPTASADFAAEIVQHVREGRFVIVDQSTGDPELVASAAERIMWTLYDAQKTDFANPSYSDSGQPLPPPDILVYLEEAHNLLPSNNNDVTNIWTKTAKETSKFRIGMLMATQEPSLIQRYILSNTDNWFLGFLFSKKEVKVLSEYGDFAQFETHIGQNADPGLLIVRTLSNPYSVPVQIRRFKLTVPGHGV